MKYLPVVVIFVIAIGVYYAGYSAANKECKLKITKMELTQQEAINDERKKQSEKLSASANTILLAQSEYDILRTERDNLLKRLRESSAANISKPGHSVESLRKRIAELEGMVERMAEAASRCGDGFERCAQKHDALVEIVK